MHWMTAGTFSIDAASALGRISLSTSCSRCGRSHHAYRRRRQPRRRQPRSRPEPRPPGLGPPGGMCRTWCRTRRGGRRRCRCGPFRLHFPERLAIGRRAPASGRAGSGACPPLRLGAVAQGLARQPTRRHGRPTPRSTCGGGHVNGHVEQPGGRALRPRRALAPGDLPGQGVLGTRSRSLGSAAEAAPRGGRGRSDRVEQRVC